MKPYRRWSYPAFLNLEDRDCIVIGGGAVAAQKVKVLVECGARVQVVSPTIHPDISAVADKGLLTIVPREFTPSDLDDAFLVIAASDDNRVNRTVAREARQRRILVNVVDDPRVSDFIVPSSVRRGPLTVAISTMGYSPALSRKLRVFLEELIGEEYEALVPVIGTIREDLKGQGTTVDPEKWQEALDLELLTRLARAGRWDEIRAALWNALAGEELGKST